MLDLEDQVNKVLEDQLQELSDLRKKRKEARENISELDAREIDILLGIRTTKNILSGLTEKGER